MRRALAVAAVLLGLAAGAVARAGHAANPFYLVPPEPRKECNNVKHCTDVIGPWVVVPADGEATFLLQCPKRRGYVGGTATRASSGNVHVWFDGQIGAPIQQSVTTGAFLLFHAVTTNGKPGLFEPALGCIRLTAHTLGRSTVSARRAGELPGTTPGAPLDLRAKLLVLVKGTSQKASVSCPRGERLVGSWSSLAFSIEDLPASSLKDLDKVKTKRTVAGGKVTVRTDTAPTLPFIPLAEVQVGATCT